MLFFNCFNQKFGGASIQIKTAFSRKLMNFLNYESKNVRAFGEDILRCSLDALLAHCPFLNFGLDLPLKQNLPYGRMSTNNPLIKSH